MLYLGRRMGFVSAVVQESPLLSPFFSGLGMAPALVLVSFLDLLDLVELIEAVVAQLIS